jgi:hypothetical protein
MEQVPDVNMRSKTSMQSRINTGPNFTVNMISYNNLLDYTGWTRADLNNFEIELGKQIRYLVNDPRRGIKYCAGGFLLANEELYLLYRGYSGYRWTVQKSDIIELWYRNPKTRGKNKKKKN